MESHHADGSSVVFPDTRRLEAKSPSSQFHRGRLLNLGIDGLDLLSRDYPVAEIETPYHASSVTLPGFLLMSIRDKDDLSSYGEYRSTIGDQCIRTAFSDTSGFVENHILNVLDPSILCLVQTDVYYKRTESVVDECYHYMRTNPSESLNRMWIAFFKTHFVFCHTNCHGPGDGKMNRARLDAHNLEYIER
jgi:hypothetical protein